MIYTTDNTKEEAYKEAREFAENNGLLKLIKGSSLKILKMNKNKRKDFFEGMSLSKARVLLANDKELFLIKENILAYTDKNLTKITITFKGIVILEYGLATPDISTLRLLDDLNSMYFTKVFEDADFPLSSEEKAIIITFLGLMAFSPESSLKLSSYKDSHSNIDDFKNCVEKSIEFLKFLGPVYVDSTLDKIWASNVRGEDPVNAKMARLNDISPRTNGIYYKGQRKEGHYLNLLKNQEIDSADLEFLLKKLFDKGILSSEQREKFIGLLKQIFSERHNFIINSSEFDLLTNFYSMSNIIRTFG
jgi:hypothetical protein